MYMLIRLRNGSVVKAAMLAKSRSWMRVAVPGFDDAIELRRCGPVWLDECDEPIQFAFTSLVSSGSCWPRLTADANGETCRAWQSASPAGFIPVC